jgi:hypothetical protein
MVAFSDLELEKGVIVGCVLLKSQSFVETYSEMMQRLVAEAGERACGCSAASLESGLNRSTRRLCSISTCHHPWCFRAFPLTFIMSV